MNERSVVIIGLPESGKSTFLGALWHIITEADIDTLLRLESLGQGDRNHLNALASRWRDARVQDRTAIGGNRLVVMNLADRSGASLRVTFPDTAGEAYQHMWEARECDPDVADTLKYGNVLLFVHSDTIQTPMWVVDDAALSRRMGLQPAGQLVSWHPRLAPTQVQLVELLQFLSSDPLDSGPRRLAIMLSAWDKVVPEVLSPAAFLEAKLPLVAQYLRHSGHRWTSRVYGLSAQGGDYDPIEENAAPKPEAEQLRNLDRPSTRIRLLGEIPETHDLTEPLAWLMA
jgi:Double-GTPase 1